MTALPRESSRSMGCWDSFGDPLGAEGVVSGVGVVAAGAGVLVAGLGDVAAPGWLVGVVPQAARPARPARTATTAERLNADMALTSVLAFMT